MVIKTKLPKITDFVVKLKGKSKLVIFGNFVLITMDEPNKLQKMYNYLEKAEGLSFLHMVVHFL